MPDVTIQSRMQHWLEFYDLASARRIVFLLRHSPDLRLLNINNQADILREAYPFFLQILSPNGIMNNPRSRLPRSTG